MRAPLFRGQNTETRELSVYPAEPNQIKSKIKRTEVMDLLYLILVLLSLINMHNKYFWTSTLPGVPRWESVMRTNNLVETLFTILFLSPIKAVTKLRPRRATHWAKQLDLKCLVSANTANHEQKRKGKIMHMTNSVKNWGLYSWLLKMILCSDWDLRSALLGLRVTGKKTYDSALNKRTLYQAGQSSGLITGERKDLS